MSKVHGIIDLGFNGTIVDIECRLSNNLPTIVIVGSANKAVSEARERIRGAFATSRIMLPRKRITVNLAPADVPKADSGFDLAIAVAILQADGQVTINLADDVAFIGELGLNGRIRAVRGIIGKILTGRKHGIKRFYIPTANLEQAQLIPHVELIPLDSLGQLFSQFSNGIDPKPLLTSEGLYAVDRRGSAEAADLNEIVGQHEAKRALVIAAAGGHNLLLSGPPGTGKSMLARTLASLLPPMNREEILEVTHLHSLVSHDYDKIIDTRPFRAPHHSASHLAIVGGGNKLKPGEISLAHHGVLLFDELPEFDRGTLESLRQPLEERVINMARANETAVFPANFMFIATANLCPCGYYSYPACSCSAGDIKRYQSRISGPILDRIDLQCSVDEVNHDRLLAGADPTSTDKSLKSQIAKARRQQSKRFPGEAGRFNADMTNNELKRWAKLESTAASALNAAARQLNISARSYMRTVKVARTIADLDSSESITIDHVAEAIKYRPQPLSKATA